MDNSKNPIINYVGGVPIRKRNQLSISVGEMQMRRLVEVSIDTGLSIPQIIAMQGMPCQKCGNDNIVIEKGILSAEPKKKKSGGNIVSRKKKNNK